MSLPGDRGPAAIGRPRVTSRVALEALAFRMFAVRGFENTTISDITRAARVGQRTFFRYFASKNDLVWGNFDGELWRFRQWFATSGEVLPVGVAVRRGVVEFNRYPKAQQARHRERMSLILNVPALRADSTLRFVQWRSVIAEFIARRLGGSSSDLLPTVLGHGALGAAVSAYEVWLRDDSAELTQLLEEALVIWGRGLSAMPA